MSGETTETGNKGMKDLITVVNRLQDAFSTSGLPFGLELPQIVVIGGQSAGKSSVLENFVGKDFLPRGAGIVTRRPLVLQLIYSETEYAEFLHYSNKRFTDFNEVRREIEAETDRETGSNKGISHKPINLKVYSPNVLDLTLVDLPGMTRVAVGDQPPDIEKQIRDMVHEYASRENSLILAVSPANSDLANSDAMRVAKEVDPTGHRTIGVITKLDLMDEGTDARDILLNKLLPLKRGYIGVVNRSQRDIEGKKDIRAALEAEKQFFQKHSAYKDLSDQLGTAFLQQVLNRELGRHIQETLPAIRQSLRKRISEIEKELKTLKDCSSDDMAQKELVRCMQEFMGTVETQIQGLNADIDTHNLSGGAQINRLFYNEFADSLSLEQMPENILKREVAYAIRNIHGIRNGIFTPDMAFNATVVKIIQRFKDPLCECVDVVVKVLTDVIEKAAEKKMSDYPRLHEEVLFLLKTRLQSQEEKAKEHLVLHVEAETSFMNTRHEDFIGKSASNPDSAEFTQSISALKKKIEATAKALQKGWVALKGTKRVGARETWLVLTLDSLTGFTESDEQEVIFSLHLNAKVKLKENEKKFKITLYNVDSKDIVLSIKTLEFTCEDEADMRHWVSCFNTAGVFSEKHVHENGRQKPIARRESDASITSTDTADGSQVQRRPNSSLVRRNRQTLKDFTKSMVDPDSEKEIGKIVMMVQSYLKIVGKTIRDIAPKYIMMLLVQNIQKFLSIELMSQILIENKPQTLMKGDFEATNRREQLTKAHETALSALKIIDAANF